jgi:phage major head subunit gpT-like protein
MNPIAIRADVTFLRADDGDGAGMSTPRIPRFSMVGYTGGLIRQSWSRDPVVIDLAGMSVPSRLPIVFGHDYALESVLGQAAARVEGGQLYVDGSILAETEAAGQVVTLGDKGYQWQASVGADVEETSAVAAGESVTVNGQTFSGPVLVVTRSALRECSFVTLGADAATAVTITASAGESPMSSDAKAAEHDMPTGPQDMQSENGDMPTGPSDVSSSKPGVDVAAIRAEVVRDVTAQVKAEVLRDLRAGRGPVIHVPSKPILDEDQVTVTAMLMAGGIRSVEKSTPEPVLEAAQKRAGSATLHSVLASAAKRNGYDGGERVHAGNLRQVLKAAFATHNISNILAATYGKSLLNGFNAIESMWDQISSIRPVSDFKTYTGVRLDGGFLFDEVGNDGKLKSADASDATRTIQAKTYGRMSSITRQDIINDDLGALTQVPQRLGRGAALKFNQVFWAAFESSNSTYFQAATPGSGNALAVGSLETAYTAYGSLTDPDGNPLGVTPQILMVPKALGITANKIQTGNTLLASSLGSTSSKVLEPQANVLAGKFQIVESAYLSSTSTWWLCADPADLPTMEVAFLNGQRQPTVEQAEADFDVLGIQVRGYFDFGVSKGESRAAYRMATA